MTRAALTTDARRSTPATPAATVARRQCACGGARATCERCHSGQPVVQRAAIGTFAGTHVPRIVGDVLHAEGERLDPATRAFFEPRFARDFSRVRVHTDTTAAQSAAAVNALAYTVGPHVVFGRERYQPGSTSGDALIAHELAHVVQQASTGVAQGLPSGFGSTASETEAHRAAAAVMTPGATAPTLSPATPAIARAPKPGSVARASLTEGEMGMLAERLLQLVERVNAKTRTSIVGWKTIAVGFIIDGDGDPRLVYTTNRNWSNPDLRAAADELGLTRLDRPPDVNARGAVGAPADAEQLMIEAVADEEGEVLGMAVSRPVCRDCHVATHLHEHGKIPIVEVEIPEPTALVGEKATRPRKTKAPKSRSGKPTGSTAAAEVEPGAAPEGTRGTLSNAPASAAAEATPELSEFRVQTQFEVIDTNPIPGGRSVTQLRVTFGEGLEPMNALARANGEHGLRRSLVLRISTDARGALVAAESTTGETAALAETLARQALGSAPHANAPSAISPVAETGGAPALETVAGGARPPVSPWVRGIGWAGLAVFVLLTARRYSQAQTREDKARVLTGAGAGFLGGAASSYLLCNLVLGIETLGWSLLICGFAAGIPGAVAGESIADTAFDEATVNKAEIRTWVAGTPVAVVREIPATEKARMILSLMKGWIGDRDIAAITAICHSVGRESEMAEIRRAVEPYLLSMWSVGQRTQVRAALAHRPE